MPLKLVESRKATAEEQKSGEIVQRDFEWMAEHSAEISQNYRGKYIAVVNEEVFVGKTKEEIVKLLREKYPSRRPFVRYIPFKKKIKIL